MFPLIRDILNTVTFNEIRMGPMNLKFIVNDYILVWNLLFQASISEKIQNFKQKLWINYKKQYNNTFPDNMLMLKDYKNFIKSLG